MDLKILSHECILGIAKLITLTLNYTANWLIDYFWKVTKRGKWKQTNQKEKKI